MIGKMNDDETYYKNPNASLNLIQDLTSPRMIPTPPMTTNPNVFDKPNAEGK